MTTLVGDLVDRTIRDWLVPPDQQPPRVTLASSLDASSSTVDIDNTLLPPEVADILSPGQVLELGREQIIVGDIDGGETQLTNCIRGVNGTTAATHDTGKIGLLSPPFARQSVFDAISDAILTLYPSLYHLHTEELTTASNTWVEVPADYLSPQSLVVVDGTSVVPAQAIDLSPFPPSSTGNAIAFEGVRDGLTAYLTYRAKFHAPTGESDRLFIDLGVEPEWHRIIEVDAVAQLVAGQDLDAAYTHSISAQMQAEVFPPPSASQLHRELLRYHEYLLERASRRLKARDGLPVTFNGRFS